MNVETSNPPANDAEFEACERRIGRTIPEPYRSFLRRHNGGTPSRRGFSWTNEYGRAVLARVRSFFGVDDGEDGLMDCFETYRDRVPRDLFPIASEVGSNLLLMGTEGARTGRIFYWDHNWEAGNGEPPTYRNVHLIADSLDAFLASLTE